MPSVYFRNNDGFSLFFCTLLSNLVVFFRFIFFSRHAACVRSVLWTVEVFKLMTSSVQVLVVYEHLKCSTKCLPAPKKEKKFWEYHIKDVIRAIKLCARHDLFFALRRCQVLLTAELILCLPYSVFFKFMKARAKVGLIIVIISVLWFVRI